MSMVQVKRLEDCMEWLELTAEGYTASQSIGWLIDQLGMLSKSLAFCNNQMAIAKRELNQKKVKAYNDLIGSSVANQTYFAPSLAKDYIAAKCSEEQYNYDLSERCSRTIVHQIDTLRSCLSALKEEVKYSNVA